MTGGGADSRPMEALAEVAWLLAQNKLVIKVPICDLPLYPHFPTFDH